MRKLLTPPVVQWGSQVMQKKIMDPLELRTNKKSLFCAFDRFIRLWALSMLPFSSTSVILPSNFLSAMCMMSFRGGHDLSFSQFRIFSSINNNIGGRKVHVQLDDEKPAGRRRRVPVVAPWNDDDDGGRAGGGPSFDVVATYVAAGAQFLAFKVGRNSPVTAFNHATSKLALPSRAAPAPASPSSWQPGPARRWLASPGTAGRPSTERVRGSIGSGDRGRDRASEGVVRERTSAGPTSPQSETLAQRWSISQFAESVF